MPSKSKPDISVLMPVFNAERTLNAAIWSILNQSHTNFEFIIYLDGCTDKSEQIIRDISDKRIRLIISESNKGIVHARNELVNLANGKFIAWLDADDIALPGRLAYQYDYMDVHPNIWVFGSWVEVRNSRWITRVKWPSQNHWLQAWSFFRNPLVQSSLMLRNVPSEIFYEPEFEYLEDYRLLTRLMEKGELGIYPEYLCSYFEEEEQFRIAKYLKYDFVTKLEKIMQYNFNKLGLEPGKNELSLIREFLRNTKKLKPNDAQMVFAFFKNALVINNKKGVFHKEAFSGVCTHQILRLMIKNISLLPKILWFLFTNPLSILAAYKAKVYYVN